MNREDQTKELLTRLNDHFTPGGDGQMNRARLAWSPKGDNSFYRGIFRELHIAGETWMGIDATVLHEFAHHLTKQRGQWDNHTTEFTQALLDVTDWAYGEDFVEFYPWEYEYKSVIRYGGRQHAPIREKFGNGNIKQACRGRSKKLGQCIAYGRHLNYADDKKTWYCKTHMKQLQRKGLWKYADGHLHDPEVPSTLQSMLTFGGG